MKRRHIPIIAVTSVEHSRLSESRHSSGKKLYEVADLVIDNGAIPGDAMVKVDGLTEPVGPGSTIGNTVIVNLIKCQLAKKLTAAGRPPKVITSPVVVGKQESARLFNESYEQYWSSTRYL